LKVLPTFKDLSSVCGRDLSQTLMLAQVARVQEVTSGDRHGYTVGLPNLSNRVTMSEDHGIVAGLA